MSPDLSLETRLGPDVIGIDEVGRGPWAGPVVAAAALVAGPLPEGVNDSKRLSLKRRDALFALLDGCVLSGIGWASVEEIDRLNIGAATHLAMCRAVADLSARHGVAPRMALVDGNRIPPGLPCPAEAVVGGDGKSLSIAAASILAKVTRDRHMAELALECPGYGWDRNAGYGTREHSAALQKLGVSPHHRRSFKPIHNILCKAK